MSTEMEIDEGLYSRVQYVMGKEAMQQMGGSSVLVVGMGSLGCEVAKNLTLTGMGSVGVYDEKAVSWWDLGGMFWASEADIGRKRLEVVVPRLKELNAHCDVQAVEGPLTAELLSNFNVVIFCNSTALSALCPINEAVRAAGVKMIWAESRGVLGMVFTDFGSEHNVIDATGITPAKHVVVSIAGSTITVDDEEPLSFSEGDLISINSVETADGYSLPPTLFKVTKKSSLYSLEVEGLVCPPEKYIRGGYLTEVKQPVTVEFSPLEQLLQSASPPLSGDGMSDPKELHDAFAAMHEWSERNNGALPSMTDLEHLKEIQESAAVRGSSSDAAAVLVQLCEVSFNPLACYIGGISAQEVLKACTGKFMPIRQHYYYDGRHALPDGCTVPPHPEGKVATSRNASLAAVIGMQNMARVHDMNVFMVGCGALGCEFLKNFALLGIGSGKKGFVTVADPDKIERSNLSRQFLFRDCHVGGFKCKVAAEQAKKMNPSIKLMPKTVKICEDTEAQFNQRFWAKQDQVINALDNVRARLYVDAKCVTHKKKMIDSGTLGSQAHAQVVLPKLSENYGAQQDPQEKAIPQCTLHFFPNNVEHTIAFARDWFGGAFEAPAGMVTAMRSDPEGYYNKLQAMPEDVRMMELEALHSATCTPRDIASCIRWAGATFTELFTTAIEGILEKHPLDKRDEKGVLFWTGKFKPPHVLRFSLDNEIHVSCLQNMTRMRCDLLGVPFSATECNREGIAKALSESSHASTGKHWEAMFAQVKDSLIGKGVECTHIEFDKDGAGNGHIPCIASVANLRAECYKIPTVSEGEVKRITGKIIPAMITTTALITGLVTMEMLKANYYPPLPLERFRNAWVNLADAFMLSSEVEPPLAKPYLSLEQNTEKANGPIPASFALHPLHGKTWTVWDTMEIQAKGDATLGQFLEAFSQKYKIDVSQLATDSGTVLYSEFNPLHQSEIFQECGFTMPLGTLVAKVTAEPHQKVIDFVVKGKVDGVFLGPLPTVRYKIM